MESKFSFNRVPGEGSQTRRRSIAVLLAVLTAVSMLLSASFSMTAHADGTKYSVTIRNVDENGNQKAGCGFEIYKEGESKPVITFTSDTTATTVQLEPGDYVLKQTKVTGQYDLADDANFTVEDNGQVKNGETTKKYYIQSLSLAFNYPAKGDEYVYTKDGQQGQYTDINGNIVEWESDYSANMMKVLNPDDGGIEYVYCFNKKKAGVDRYNKAKYYSQNSTPELFSEYSDSLREDSETAYKNILGILYSGFPNDGSGLKAKYNLTDRQFYAVTQWAIWYQTDSVRYSENTAGVSNKPDDATDEWTDDMKSAYSELCGKYYTDNDTTAEFFTTTDSIFGDEYQNMIGARFVKKQQKVTVSNAPKLAVEKIDNNGDPVKGATLKISKMNDSGTRYIDMEGMEWTTDGKTHYINTAKFSPNEVYKLEETNVPDGYEKAAKIIFTIDANYNIYIRKYVSGKGYVYEKQDTAALTLVDVKKPEVEFRKVDSDTGAYVTGAGLTLTKAGTSGSEVIESWTTDGNSHMKVLDAGTYTLTETSAPQGYEKADPIRFIIGTSGKMYLLSDDGTKTEASEAVITMKDTQIKHSVTFRKVDADSGDALTGAELELVSGSSEDGESIESWTTDGNDHAISLPAGTYTLVERAAPEGYDTADPITFRVDDEGMIHVITDGVESVAQEAEVTMEDESIPVTPSENPQDETPETPDSENPDSESAISTPSSETGSPLTGDMGMTSVYIALIAAAAAAAWVIFSRRRKAKYSR
ncbi:MAG: SpaA isopeptide-forming pilin-related protein [Anaerovoracaceae bacterium]|jgi:TQXA domain-containing protein